MKKNLTVIAMIIGYWALTSLAAQAGFMDKLNSAAQKLNEKAQQAQTGKTQPAEDPDHPLHLEDHYKGSCEGHRSATCMDYMEVMDQCMDPLRGYRMKILGDRIEYKLKNEQLTDAQRKTLQEDLDGAREAEKNKSEDPTIAGEKNSQRYLSDIADEDQIWVNAEYGRFHNKIFNKCEGADHMQTGHRTEMITEEGMTGDEAVTQYRQEHTRKKETNNCLTAVTGVRYKIMADMLENKMKTSNLSAKEHSDWEADIAALRQAAQQGGNAMPQVNDPANPYRPMTRLSSPEEMMQVNNEFTKQSQALLAECKQKSGDSSPDNEKLKAMHAARAKRNAGQ